MKLRATSKLLKIVRIKPIADSTKPLETMPGEWYAGLVSLGSPGKMAIQFLHYPTYISQVVPTKSLLKAVPLLKQRVEAFLTRNGFETLIPLYNLDSPPEIFKTNSRSMLGHMNQLKFIYEYSCALESYWEDIDFAKLEDHNLTYLFGSAKTPGKYLRPLDLLKGLVNTI